MSEARLNIRIDANIKAQAEHVFQQLGLTMSSGVNIFLSRVAAEQGIPFQLTLNRAAAIGNDTYSFETAVANIVRDEIANLKYDGKPVARYDGVKKRPYLEYPDGRREYSSE